MANNYGYMAKIGIDTSGLQAGLKDINASLKETDRSISATDKAIATAANAGLNTTQLWEQQYSLLNTQIETVSEKLTSLESVQNKVAEAYENGAIDYSSYIEFQNEVANTAATLENLKERAVQANNAISDSSFDGFKTSLTEINQHIGDYKSRLGDINTALQSAKNAHLNFTDTMELNRQKTQALKDIVSELKEKYKELKSEASTMKEALRVGSITKQEYEDFCRALIETKAEMSSLKHKTGEYGDQAKDAGDKTSTFGDVLKANLTSEAIIKGVEKLAQSIKSIIEDVERLVNETMNEGDAIDKQSQILGLSREAYQEWGYVLNMNGASISNLTTGTRTLTNAVEKANNGTDSAVEAFARLGLSIDQINAMSREELFEAVIYGLQDMTNEQERNEVANDLLGRSYVSLIPLLNQTSESTKGLAQAAHDNNMIMSDEAVDSAVKYKDSLTTLNYTLKGIKDNLLYKIMPGISDVTDGISDIAAGREDGAEKIVNGISETADSVFNILNETVDTAEKIIDIAAEHIPEIIKDKSEDVRQSASKLVNELINEIGEHSGDVVSIGFNIIGNIVTGLGDAAVTLTEQGGVIVSSLVGALIEAIPDVAEFALNFCERIADDLINFDWADAAGQAMNNLINSLDNAQKKVMLWMDNTFNDGKVYGGDIENVNGNSEIIQGWKQIADSAEEYLGYSQNFWQESYDSGMEMLGKTKEIVDETKKQFADNQEMRNNADIAAAAVLEKYKNSIDNETQSTVRTIQQSAKDLKDAQKEFENQIQLRWEAAERAQKENGESDQWLADEYKNIIDDLEKGSDIYYKYYDKWLDKTVKISEDTKKAAQKATDAEVDAWKKSSDEVSKAVEKKYSDVQKAYESAKGDYIAGLNLYSTLEESSDASSKVLRTASAYNKNSEDTSEKKVLADINEQTKKLKEYRKNMEKLESTGISSEYLEKIKAMDLDSRMEYVAELVKLRPEKLQKHYEDINAYYKEAHLAGLDDTKDQKAEADSLAEQSKKSILSSWQEMSPDARKAGEEAANAYIDGFTKVIDETDSLLKITAPVSSKKSASQQNTAYVSSNETKNAAALSTPYSAYEYPAPSTPVTVTINIAPQVKKVVNTTVDEIFGKIRNGGGKIDF